MLLTGLLDDLAADPQFAAVAETIAAGQPGAPVVLENVPASIHPVVIAALAREQARPILVITSRQEAAARLRESLAPYLASGEDLLLWMAHDALPYDQLPFDPVAASSRLGTLDRLLQAGRSATPDPFVLITSARGLQGQLMHRETLSGWRQELRVGDQIDLSALLTRWVEGGYEPVVAVEEAGQFSRRGGIVDLFPSGSEQPVRIELFGDEIDSIRPFDPGTQRSTGRLTSITVLPARELPLWERQDALRLLQEISTGTLRSEIAQEWERGLRLLDRGELPPTQDLFAPYFSDQPAGLLDYLPDNALVIITEPDAVRLAAEQVEVQAEELRRGFEASGELPPGLRRPYHTWVSITARLGTTRQVHLGYSAGLPADARSFTCDALREPATYTNRMQRLANDLKGIGQRAARAVIVSEQAERLSEILAARDLYPHLATATLPEPLPPLTLVHGALSAGWVYNPTDHHEAASDEPGRLSDGALLVLSDRDLFGTLRVVRRASRRTTSQHQAFVRSLTVGQYVVHLEHGIARYTGLMTRTVGETLPDGTTPTREFLSLEYAAGDRLFVPIDQTDRVAPYSGTGDESPTLNRLGSPEWGRTKSRVKRAVAEMADELLALYAARETTPGHAFAQDGVWDRELAESFPFVETDDQVKAIEDVRGDMELSQPMDRLVTGDVGYGKTEVAVRAAFKAVNDGAQVAVLVPTTVLALQHTRTFKERLAPFPVRIEMLSRLRTPSEREAVKAALASGNVDIVIGTHALLSTDIRFRNLGLLIVDEEQRFGVAHKETLKKLRTTVDVLTMTATPIPRTLHTALAGLRNLSVIETPPADRLPIRTFVVPYNDTLVREVILREIDRGGQVYYVHNRVQTLDMVAAHLARLIPEARIRTGHGQMDQGALEKVMLAFVNAEFDVLVCTTIIESGIDIPSVNTMIIDDAPHFGLTQLHQLRGRVGRSGNRAYCYLFYREGIPMTPDAQERLETIANQTALGAGLKIAMRDLELRGAGNLLGAEQSGHIAAVGFDLYVQLLAAAVEERRTGIPVEEERPVLLDLPITALLPNDFIVDTQVRIKEYRRIAAVRTQAELDDLLKELIDRFGPLPDEVRALGYLTGVKIQALELGLEAISYRDGVLALRPFPTGRLDQEALRRQLGDALFIGPTSLRLNTTGLKIGWEEALDLLLEALRTAKAAIEEDAAAEIRVSRTRQRHARERLRG